MTVIFAKRALTSNGWADNVAISVGPDGRIAHLGPADRAPDHRIDLALPAPANLHSHSFQRAMAGLTETRGPDPRDSFWTWRHLMYRFLDQLDPDHIEAIAAQVFMEMLETGYAAVGEFHYLHHAPGGAGYDNPAELADRITAAATTVGIGLTHLPVLYQFAGADQRALNGGQLRFGSTPARFAELHAATARGLAAAPVDYGLGVAPHSLRAVDGDGLAAVQALSAGGPLHIHAAEQRAEVDEIEVHLGGRPVEWLLDTQPVDETWCLIHCTQMTASETERLAKSGAVAGLCPITEANLGDGIFNGVDYIGAGGRLGVGSDSNVNIALSEELALLDYTQRLRDHSRAAFADLGVSAGRRLFDLACSGGAQALGRRSGALEDGAWADIIGLSTNGVWACGHGGDRLLDSFVFGGRGARAVRDVWSAGRHMVVEGNHIDQARITARFCATMGELRDLL